MLVGKCTQKKEHIKQGRKEKNASKMQCGRPKTTINIEVDLRKMICSTVVCLPKMMIKKMQTYLGPNKFPQDINDFGKLKLRREDFRLVFVTLLI